MVADTHVKIADWQYLLVPPVREELARVGSRVAGRVVIETLVALELRLVAGDGRAGKRHRQARHEHQCPINSHVSSLAHRIPRAFPMGPKLTTAHKRCKHNLVVIFRSTRCPSPGFAEWEPTSCGSLCCPRRTRHARADLVSGKSTKVCGLVGERFRVLRKPPSLRVPIHSGGDDRARVDRFVEAAEVFLQAKTRRRNLTFRGPLQMIARHDKPIAPRIGPTL